MASSLFESAHEVHRVLVITGGAGFIGSALARRALDSKAFAEVHIVDKLDPESALDGNVPRGATLHPLNLCAKGRFTALLKEVGATHVAHLAAESHVDRSFDNPSACAHNNITSTLEVLEACVAVSVTRLLHMSTDEVYGDGKETASVESDPFAPTNPYAASKGACELFVKAYVKAYGLNVVVARGNNVFGPRQAPDKVVPKFIRQTLAREHCSIHGDGSQRRSFIYVDDMAEALHRMLVLPELNGEILNIEGSHELSIRELAREIRENMALSLESVDGIVSPTTRVADRPYNDKRYWVDGSRSIALLGQYNSMPFREGLRRTIAWYATRKLGPPKMRVLVVGYKGLIGRAMLSALKAAHHEVIVPDDSVERVGSSTTDAREEVWRDLIACVEPTHVLCTAGRTNTGDTGTIDDLEPASKEEGPGKTLLNVRDNVYVPTVLAAICTQMGVHFTTVNTGCIYTFSDMRRQHEVFREDDPPCFFGSSYSVAKGFTDRMLGVASDAGCSVLNARIRLPIMDKSHPRNALDKLAKYTKVPAIRNSVTYLTECMPLLVEAMHRRMFGPLNLVNPDPVPLSTIKRAISGPASDGDSGWTELPVDRLHEMQAIVGRSQCVLSTDRLVALAEDAGLPLTGTGELCDMVWCRIDDGSDEDEEESKAE